MRFQHQLRRIRPAYAAEYHSAVRKSGTSQRASCKTSISLQITYTKAALRDSAFGGRSRWPGLAGTVDLGDLQLNRLAHRNHIRRP